MINNAINNAYRFAESLLPNAQAASETLATSGIKAVLRLQMRRTTSVWPCDL